MWLMFCLDSFLFMFVLVSCISVCNCKSGLKLTVLAKILQKDIKMQMRPNKQPFSMLDELC